MSFVIAISLGAAATVALAGVDPPPLPAPGAAGPLPSMPTELDPVLTATGAIREARVVEGRDGVYRIELRTAAGWSRHRLDAVAGEGTSYTLTGLRLIDRVGDAEPELEVEYESYRDPCGCDDGPTYGETMVVVCEVGRNGPRCSAPVVVGLDDNRLDPQSFRGELVISRSGVARVRVLESDQMSRRELANIRRPFRLFR